MRAINIVAALALAVMALAGCSAPTSTHVDLSSPDKVAANVACSAAVATANAVAAADEATAPGQRAVLRSWGLDPENKDAIAEVREALRQKAEECATQAAETPNPAPKPTPAPSTTTASPPSSYLGWDMMVGLAPAGLKDAIQANSAKLGFDWAKVEEMGRVTRPSGNPPDARVVLVFGRAATDAAAARKAVDVTVDLPVVDVVQCTAITGNACPDKGVEVILAPVDGKGVPTLGSGIVLKDDYPLVAGLAGTQLK